LLLVMLVDEKSHDQQQIEMTPHQKESQ